MTVVFDLPTQRPAGLRRPRAIEVTLTRVDTTDPACWSWAGFAQPYHRFDPLTGGFRVRYAGWTPRTALRERFPERRIPQGDADLYLVTLRGRVRMLDLTSETVLDALGIDDRISTGGLPQVRTAEQPDPFLDACGRLTELVASWWEDVHAIRYPDCTDGLCGGWWSVLVSVRERAAGGSGLLSGPERGSWPGGWACRRVRAWSG